MSIPQILIKKKAIIVVATVVGTSIAGGTWYVMRNYSFTKPASVTPAKQEVTLPNSQVVNLSVNNFMGSIPVKTVVESVTVSQPVKQNVIAPPIIAKTESNSVEQLMQQVPNGTAGSLINKATNAEKPKPNMLVISANDNNNAGGANAISGTNTSIGTGEIDSKLKSQRSPYTVFAGTFIPASMVTGLNSDLNGQIVAIVRNDVYDTTTGKYLLIPQGSRLIGTYNHDIAYGMNRLMAGWNRVIYPNGTSFVLKGQPGTDLQGFSGMTGEVDNHWMERFGSSALVGLIFGGMTAATGNQATNPYELSAGATIASQVGAQMSQTGLQVIQKGLNIPPTIIISPGYKFNILTTADLVLKPYVYK